MKKSYFLLLVCMIVYSCSKSNDEAPNTFSNELSSLPEDKGGINAAMPLGSTDAIFGHYIYTPSEYSNNGPKYPLILFLHGSAERGNSETEPSQLDKVLVHGPSKLIENEQWAPPYPSIVVSPQLASGNWNANEIHDFIKYLVDNYQINTSRIYITGLSLGGIGIWGYIGNKGDESYAAAVVPICGKGNPNQAENFKNTPLWAFHGDDDQTVKAFIENGSAPMVQAINAINPTIKAKLTIYPGVGHDSWTKTYNGSGMGQESSDYDAFNMSIYEWMFQYKKK